MPTQYIRFESIDLEIEYHFEDYLRGDEVIGEDLIIDKIAADGSSFDIKELISDEKNEEIYKKLTEYLAKVKAGI